MRTHLQLYHYFCRGSGKHWQGKAGRMAVPLQPEVSCPVLVSQGRGTAGATEGLEQTGEEIPSSK